MTVGLEFLLLPGFSMLGFTCAIEPFRVANRFRPGSYRWRLRSLDGAPVTASSGLILNVEAGIGEIDATGPPSSGAILFIVSGFEPLDAYSPALKRLLHRWARSGAVLGGVDTGSFTLAEAGLLDGHQATLHWETIPAFEERYPRVQVSQALYQIDRQRITCAGGTSALDLMLALIATHQDHALALEVSEQFVLGRIRSRQDHQRTRTAMRYGITNPRLVSIVEELERCCDTPLDTADLARHHGISVRQLERLFKHQLAKTPTLFHLELRMRRARQLLREGGSSVLEVAIACGFTSSSYFSRCYRACFGLPPSRDRRAAASDIDGGTRPR